MGRFTVKSLYTDAGRSNDVRTIVIVGVSRISLAVPVILATIQVIFRDLILFLFVLRSDRRFCDGRDRCGRGAYSR